MTSRKLQVLGASQVPSPLASHSRAIDVQSRPYHCVWEVTLRCDLSCIHCGSRAGKARPDELTTAECLDLIDQLAEIGVREVSLIGGEAYLRDDWTTLIRAIRAKGMRCGVVTGGRGMNPERALQAKQAGVSGVSVSVDGSRDSHDKLRGLRGSFDAAISALKNLGAQSIPVAANTQINQLSRNDLPALLEQLIELGIYGWQLQLTVAMGRAADHPELLLQPYDLLELMPQLAALALRCREAGVRFAPGNNVGYYGPYESTLRASMPGGHCESCTAGVRTLGIEANGDIKGCPSLPSADYVGGNIRTASLVEIWERAPALRFARDRGAEERWGFCKTCYYADECRAGCSWTSHVLFGRRGNNPYCHHRALELERQGLRERLIPAANSSTSGAPFDYAEFELVEEPCP